MLPENIPATFEEFVESRGFHFTQRKAAFHEIPALMKIRDSLLKEWAWLKFQSARHSEETRK